MKAKSPLKNCPIQLTDKPSSIPKIQIGQRQVSEYQKGGMPFGLGDGLALAFAHVTVEPQPILKLRQNKQISVPRLVRH